MRSTCAEISLLSHRVLDSWEECLAVDLVKGDVVTHWWDLDEKKWVPVAWFGNPCGGWLIEESSDTHVRGYRLSTDGRTKDSSLQDIMSLQWATRLRVRPWDAAEQKSEPSRWNSTCARCGKGVYVGFSSVEHEGDCK